MPQRITKGIKELVAEARARVQELKPEDVIALYGRDDIVIVDIRDIRELQREGKIPGSYHCPRGMVEFWIDPESPYFKDIFAENKRFIFHCAGGLRSALAADIAQTMGLKPVAHMWGGFAGWVKQGGPVEAVLAKSQDSQSRLS